MAQAVVFPAWASELILTGISVSGGTVRAFFSVPGHASTFTLQLHEEFAGIRFERVNRRTSQVWIVQSGQGRWVSLGSPGREAMESTTPASGSGAMADPRLTASSSREWSGPGGSQAPSPATNEGLVPAEVGVVVPSTAGAGDAETTSAGPHRWRPGVVREPTAAELYRTRHGAAALEAAVRNGRLPAE